MCEVESEKENVVQRYHSSSGDTSTREQHSMNVMNIALRNIIISTFVLLIFARL